MTIAEQCETDWLRRRGKRSAFTLVELLVVISIIALLISILLPSLKSARQQAKTLKAQANVANIAKAAAAYHSEENDWLPGSPGTTGSLLLGRYDSSTALTENLLPGSAVQTWDYAGPLAGTQMQMRSLPTSRPERWKVLISGIFEDPMNRFESEPYHQGRNGPQSGFSVQKMLSFYTVRNFLMWPRTVDGGRPPFAQASFDQIGGDTSLARGFLPRMDRVGTPSEKVFLATASRFTTDDGIVDHQISWTGSDSATSGGAGGAFSTGGPTLPVEFLRTFHPRIISGTSADPLQRHKFSYRHPKGRTSGIVVSYFDTHAGWMSEKESRFPNPWWPKGTIIPAQDMNRDTLLQVRPLLQQGERSYRVPR